MSIEIPGEPTFRRPTGAPVQHIHLPFEVGPPGGPAAILIVAGGLLGVLMLFGAGAMLLATTRSPSALQATGIVLAGVLVAAIGVCFSGPAFTALADRLRGHPTLVLDIDGFRDTRSMRQPIAWSHIVQAKITYQDLRTRTGIAGVQLTLRDAIEARHNPFRIGALGFYWRRRPNELYVPLMALAARPHTVAHAIAALVTRHGGAVDI